MLQTSIFRRLNVLGLYSFQSNVQSAANSMLKFTTTAIMTQRKNHYR